MTEPRLDIARARWELGNAPARLVATRENHVYRVEHEGRVMALRLHRPGLRTKAQLVSELQWMAALAASGLTVPVPLPASDGSLCVEAAGSLIDMVSWLDGEPMGRDGALADLADPRAAFYRLGGAMAQLHDVSDRWTPPEGFVRPHWDQDGLVGEAPLWGRFWDSVLLDEGQAALMRTARGLARERLRSIASSADYGLIHADLVPENVLVSGAALCMIDFDDGGFGFRLFDLATSANRADRADPSGGLRQALVDGYLSRRAIDLTELPLFQAVRAFTYAGWISERMNEPGARERAARLVGNATRWAAHLFDR